ncbi:MAG: Holliday junction branch migration protein RuvA [Candidatus Magasanikbacteria bacterium]|nr:Holliday junction branch migration protein RuvA [Candidatus Magasanikbacteria bacterium]
MISIIQGKIVKNQNGEVVVMTAGGVGYRVKVSPNAGLNCTAGKEVTLDTYLIVREDVLELFGFANIAEKELFKQFITVSGVGPKTALHLLSLGTVEEITIAIGRGDIEYLTKVSGIGKKTAERIVVDLKSKLKAHLEESGSTTFTPGSDTLGDVIDALVTLGYSVLQARETAKKLEPAGKTSEQLLREALRSIK